MSTKGWEKRVDPRWVPSFLEAIKNEHGLQQSSSCNHNVKFLPAFCITCLQLFCRICPEFKGTKHLHQHHIVLLVHKASGENCLHARDVSKLIDISDIQPFMIENEAVVSVRRRCSEQSKSGSNKSCNICKTCGRELQGGKKFCSLQCKSESGENMWLMKQKVEGKGKGKRKEEEEVGEIGDDEASIKAQSYRKWRRKGVPIRSPHF